MIYLVFALKLLATCLIGTGIGVLVGNQLIRWDQRRRHP